MKHTTQTQNETNS